MKAILAFLVAVVCCVYGSPVKRDSKTENVDLLMPTVQPKVKDTYLCYGMKMNETPTYIVGFRPHANKEIAHHMLLYGCKEPGVRDKNAIWNCGEMAHTTSSYSTAGVCGEGQQIVYAWAMDAPALQLPEGVGFKVGGNTNIDYLVLQVHYKDVSPFLAGETDSSGITLVTTDQQMPKRAGVYLLATGGRIPAHSVEYLESACPLRTDLTLHPFAFRTHTHTLGKVVSGYRVRDAKWEEIGRKSPQEPQMFYNATSPGMEIRNNDILAARCTMENNLDRTVYIGATQNDEMCNFYMMYYVNGDRIADQNSCFSSGAPYYTWESSPYAGNMNLKEQPQTVSLVPGEKTPKRKGPVAKLERAENPERRQQRPRGHAVNRNDFARLLQALNTAYDSDYKMYDNVL
ncbi:peptidylglycine alpha-hydroxylating monooxygenase-like [Ylistrum balloti]|uniref:peptidylglycine alpha-hydroxylating monooxygenase-like n=1 Tax=Ylistrum balloti TaxID=509963 RepID=UPI002905F158|nr:peptidylglycine alpha-hydroxylating monooxygenase-like [Ylistrum balloti]